MENDNLISDIGKEVMDKETADKIQKMLVDESYSPYKIFIRLDPTCVLKSVRLFIIFRALHEHGQICFTFPELQELEAVDFKRGFEVYFLSQKSLEEILRALNEILEIKNKYVLSKSKEEFKSLYDDFLSSDKLGMEIEFLRKLSAYDSQAGEMNTKIVQEQEELELSQINEIISEVQYSSMDDFQRDALKEIGNIGAGNAANALAGMINKRVDINIPSVQIIDLNEYFESIAKKNYKIVTTWSIIVGDSKATILVVFKFSDVLKIISIMVEGMEEPTDLKSEDNTKSINDLPELYSSALSELGNMLASHFSIAIGKMLKINLRTQPPGMSLDIGKKLLDTINSKSELYKGPTLLINTTIMIKELMASGSCVFIPNPTTLQEFLVSLSRFLF